MIADLSLTFRRSDAEFDSQQGYMKERINMHTPQELAFTIRKLIANRPDDWYQYNWFGSRFADMEVSTIRAALKNDSSCGSTACVAGWAAILTAPEGTKLYGNGMYNSGIIFPDGTMKGCFNAGKEAFGLTDEQAAFLFDAHRTKTEVEWCLEAIEEGRAWGPMDFYDSELSAAFHQNG